ncbi:hypothetical protein Pmani_021639 [Petrolisthes manimaculis]|uniref:Uncharacterized protein n=1 Tax=Petrolisthes manimaculis TaxID=1843537 RepID=A0AAE1U2X9_9EUCA|nr:hypothetical protein Pmani_021639 [Petrolisthes manimaculis]
MARSTLYASGQIRRTELSEIGGLKALYNGTSELSERFLKGILGFNMFFSFTSFATSSKLENSSEASMCYKIKGRIYHHIDAPQEERPVPIPLPSLGEANNGRHLIGDEEPEGDRTVIPETIYTVSEEEAVAMILPHYHYDDSDSNGRYSKELKGLKERIEEKMRQEEEHKAR